MSSSITNNIPNFQRNTTAEVLRQAPRPDDVKANWLAVELGDNEYVRLREVMADDWPAIKEGADNCILFQMEIDFLEEGSDEAEDLVIVAFGVLDKEGANSISPMKMERITESGRYIFEWDLKGEDGKRVADGNYRLLVVATGRKHGPVIKQSLFPAYVAAKAPVISNAVIDTMNPVLELDGQPTMQFDLDTLAGVDITTINPDGDVIFSELAVYEPDQYTLRAKLAGPNAKPLPPGDYVTKIHAYNRVGKSKIMNFNYTYHKPPPFEISIGIVGDRTIELGDSGSTTFAFSMNQNAFVTFEHIKVGGAKGYAFPSSSGNPRLALAKGQQSHGWSPTAVGYAGPGEYYFRVTAENAYGEVATAESERVTFIPPILRNPTLELEPDSLLYGGRMASKITFTTPKFGRVYLDLRDGDGNHLKRLAGGDTSFLDPGSYTYNLDASDLDTGNYRIVMTADDSRGVQVSVEEMLSIYWRRR